jgi:trk system potassium uptake protein TrkA
MKIIICGAGHVGTFAAEALSAARHSITVIDRDPARVRAISDQFDVASMVGDCTQAGSLEEAGAREADLCLLATDRDEVNLLGASIAKGLGAKRSVARVRLEVFYDERQFGYARHLGIDRLICPEFATSQQIAHIVRNPAAIAIESFANWKIGLTEVAVAPKAPVVGKTLGEVSFPAGARLVGLIRDGASLPPRGDLRVEVGDDVVIVAQSESLPKAVRLFGESKVERRDVVVMGGGPMAVWLCRALRDRAYHIRLFEPDMARAEYLARELDWVTVLHADATNLETFHGEYLSKAHTFIAITDDDERNILGGAWAKSQGVKQAIAVVQKPIYLHLLSHVGIDMAFSPRMAAMRELNQILNDQPVSLLTSLNKGVLDVYQVRISPGSPAAERYLRDKITPEGFIIAAISHHGDAFVPHGDSMVHAHDTLLVVGPHKQAAALRTLATGV